METDHVAEPVPIQGDQHHSSPRAECHYGPIEVHRPVLVGDVWGRELDLRLFSDKVHESLRLNSGAGDIPDVVAHLEIHPTMSWLWTMSPSGNEVTTMTSCLVK